MTATTLTIIAVLLMVTGLILMMIFEYRDGWFFPILCPFMFCLIGLSILFSPPVRAKIDADDLAREKERQEIEARNNRCIDDLSKRYSLEPETIKFLLNGGKLP